MSKMSSRRMLALGSVMAVSLTACGDSTTAPGGESEVISRVTLTLTPSNGGAALTTYIDDADGSGPAAPSAQVAVPALVRGVTYNGTVKFENRLKTPAEDITAEVQAEANEHRVFITTATGTGLTITTSDVDGQNRPLGLRFTKAVSGTATAGSTRVVLCHYASTAKVATATSCTGDTDIDLTFAYTIAP